MGLTQRCSKVNAHVHKVSISCVVKMFNSIFSNNSCFSRISTFAGKYSKRRIKPFHEGTFFLLPFEILYTKVPFYCETHVELKSR